MRQIKKIYALIFLIVFSGCDFFSNQVIEIQSGWQILKGQNLSIILKDSLSSNTNSRGDIFSTQLKSPIFFKDKIILPEKSEIRGMVKSTVKYEKFGDYAKLVLLFDQIIVDEGKPFPMSASLDTKKGRQSIKIKGQDFKVYKTITNHSTVGALLSGQADGAEEGMLIGAAVGVGALMLSRQKEIYLPEGTELTIKLDADLFIPRKDFI